MKALIISVGTGTAPTKKAIQSLANAITFSIKNHNPDKTYLIASPESQEKTLPQILPKIGTHEIITIKDPDNIEQIYEDLQPVFNQIRKHYDHITVDFTSGTKTMTSALTLLGTQYEADALSYITGKRRGGIVQSGTEKIQTIQPHFATTPQKIKTATHLFNQNQFAATITITNQIEKTTTDPTITLQTTPLKNLAKSYEMWDRFHHKEAFNTLKKIEKPELAKNKKFLGHMLTTTEPDPYHIADLINNARRRGTEEKKFDDAVARLYRTIELLAQFRLKTKHQIQTSSLNPQDIPENLKQSWNITPETTKVKIPLQKAYELLEAKHDSLGTTFTKDAKLKDLLNKRNTSILAHDLKPVDQKTYTELYKKTTEYANTTIKNLKQLLTDSQFIKLNEQ